MAHVGVKRFGTRDGKKYAAQDGKADDPMRREEGYGVNRAERPEHAQIVSDMEETEPADGDEPDQGDRPEPSRYPASAVPLGREQQEQNDDRVTMT
jgi:hypothetical protein